MRLLRKIWKPSRDRILTPKPTSRKIDCWKIDSSLCLQSKRFMNSTKFTRATVRQILQKRSLLQSIPIWISINLEECKRDSNTREVTKSMPKLAPKNRWRLHITAVYFSRLKTLLSQNIKKSMHSNLSSKSNGSKSQVKTKILQFWEIWILN